MLLKISASAGSGKTYTLTQKFHERLKGASFEPPLSGCALSRGRPGYSLDEILAATFTNKAAAEMKFRILTTLKEEALAAAQQQDISFSPRQDQFSLLDHRDTFDAGRWVEHILRHYNSLQVRTIDSLLTTLVRLSVLELGLPPDFTPAFSADDYFTPAYDSLIEDLGNAGEQQNGTPMFSHPRQTLQAALEEACLTLILTTGKKGYTVRDSLRDSLQKLVDMRLLGKDVPDMQSRDIRAIIAELQEGVHALCHALLEGIAAQNLNAAKNFITYLEKLLAWQGIKELPATHTYAFKETLDDCLNKASQGHASGSLCRLYQTFSRTCRAVIQLYPLFKSALRLAPLTILATEIAERIRQEEQQGKLLPALSLPLLARKVLQGEQGVSNALCRLGTRLSHIFLDEFQDTSQEQWDSLLPLVEECLSRGGSLTYVGDVKQAIYSWRGGKAELFDNVLEEPSLLAIVPQPQNSSLPYNWRSSPQIVRHNNTFFGLIANEQAAHQLLQEMLPKKTPEEFIAQGARRAMRTFAKATQELPPGKPENGGAVHLYDIEAVTTAQVHALLEQRLHRLMTEGLFDTWRFRDVAFLVRTGSEARLIAGFLAKWDIPVVTENSFLLADQPVIRRLTALLSFLDYPLDDMALWEFITGEECFGKTIGNEPSLAPQALYAWLASLSHTQKRPPLYQLFKEAYPQAWNKWIGPFFNQAGLMSAYDMLAEIISRYDLLNIAPEYAPFLQRFRELAYLAETQGRSSLASFLHFWHTVRETEKIPLPESMDAVRIMTMHKAKGLEFPVVILPFHHTARSYEPELHTFDYQGKTFIARAGAELPQAFYSRCITEALESLHLLYVAWTRPVHELHAFITRPKSCLPHSPITRGLAVLLERYAAAADPQGYTLERLQVDEQDANAPDEANENRMQDAGLSPFLEAGDYKAEICHTESSAVTQYETSSPTPSSRNTAQGEDGWRPMGWLPRLKIFRSVLHDAAFTAERRGTLAHLCLEHLAYSPKSLAGAGAERETLVAADVARAVRHALRLFPLPLERPDHVAEDMQQCLSWFAAQPYAPAWLATGAREQGLLNETGDLFRVDLLIDEGASLLAVDYKTGAASSHYFSQVQNYMRLLAEAQNKPVRGCLVYLDEHMLTEVPL